jgi:hypothetical protein
VLLEGLGLGVVRTTVAVVRGLSDWWARRRAGPARQLEHSLRIKRELGESLGQVLHETNGDAIIRELRRKDTYPDLDNSLRGISPWFKVELKGTYFRGLEVFLSVQRVVVDRNVARPAHGEEQGARNVYVVGRIPYTAIEAIDWEGDEYYGFTHVYCRFRRKGPYEAVVLYDTRAHQLGGGREYHERLEGARWKPERYGLIRRWRDRRAVERATRG